MSGSVLLLLLIPAGAACVLLGVLLARWGSSVTHRRADPPLRSEFEHLRPVVRALLDMHGGSRVERWMYELDGRDVPDGAPGPSLSELTRSDESPKEGES